MCSASHSRRLLGPPGDQTVHEGSSRVLKPTGSGIENHEKLTRQQCTRRDWEIAFPLLAGCLESRTTVARRIFCKAKCPSPLSGLPSPPSGFNQRCDGSTRPRGCARGAAASRDLGSHRYDNWSRSSEIWRNDTPPFPTRERHRVRDTAGLGGGVLAGSGDRGTESRDPEGARGWGGGQGSGTDRV